MEGFGASEKISCDTSAKALIAAPKKIFSPLGEKGGHGPNCAMTYSVFSAASSSLGSDEHVSSEASLAEVHSLREKAVREDIARRLGQVCSNFSKTDFAALVAIMAARQVKCERRPIW